MIYSSAVWNVHSVHIIFIKKSIILVIFHGKNIKLS